MAITETTNLTIIDNTHFENSAKNVLRIGMIGDGNCAYNSVAAALLHKISTYTPASTESDGTAQPYAISEAQYTRLITAMRTDTRKNDLAQKLLDYQSQDEVIVDGTKLQYAHQYSDLYNDVEKFKQKFVDSENTPSLNEFVSYIKAQKSQQALAALTVSLAPALRELAPGTTPAAGEHASEQEILKLTEIFNLRILICYANRENTDAILDNGILRREDIQINNTKIDLKTEEVDVAIIRFPGHFDFGLIVNDNLDIANSPWAELPVADSVSVDSVNNHIDCTETREKLFDILSDHKNNLTREQTSFDQTFARKLSDLYSNDTGNADENALQQEAFKQTLEDSEQKNNLSQMLKKLSGKNSNDGRQTEISNLLKNFGIFASKDDGSGVGFAPEKTRGEKPQEEFLRDVQTIIGG